MLTLLEEELLRRLCEAAGLGLVRHTSSVWVPRSGLFLLWFSRSSTTAARSMAVARNSSSLPSFTRWVPMKMNGPLILPPFPTASLLGTIGAVKSPGRQLHVDGVDGQSPAKRLASTCCHQWLTCSPSWACATGCRPWSSHTISAWRSPAIPSESARVTLRGRIIGIRRGGLDVQDRYGEVDVLHLEDIDTRPSTAVRRCSASRPRASSPETGPNMARWTTSPFVMRRAPRSTPIRLRAVCTGRPCCKVRPVSSLR